MTTDLSLCEILLVEDNVNDVELTLRALSKNHLDSALHVVRDGQEALDFIFSQGSYASRGTKSPPKVVFLDLKLPKIDGLEVLKKIKTNNKAKTIPIVIVTSSQEAQDIQECYRLGANSFIQKPIEFDNFMQAISDAGLYWTVVNKSPS